MSDKHPDLIIAPDERKTLQTIARNECHWPYGDPSSPDFYFCGKRKAPASPYCDFHARRGSAPSPRPYRPYIPKP
jgi:GcrA cell cycle regulator